MRKLFNKLLSPLGYEINRIDWFKTRLRALLATQPIKFVQIGANDGRRFDDLYDLVTQHDCTGLVVEPLSDVFAKLQANYADYPSIVPVNAAIHATEASLTLYRADPAAQSKLPAWAAGIASFDREHLVGHGVPEQFIVPCVVNCIPLMTLLRDQGFLDADVLQIDVEGYDGEVVRAIDFHHFRPALLKFESKNLSVTERRATNALLRAHGYRILQEREDTIAWHNR